MLIRRSACRRGVGWRSDATLNRRSLPVPDDQATVRGLAATGTSPTTSRTTRHRDSPRRLASHVANITREVPTELSHALLLGNRAMRYRWNQAMPCRWSTHTILPAAQPARLFHVKHRV